MTYPRSPRTLNFILKFSPGPPESGLHFRHLAEHDRNLSGNSLAAVSYIRTEEK